MAYQTQDIEGFKRRLDIVQVIGGFTTLTRAGSRYKGVCPFHAEKEPSFHVDPERGTFHCFGCGARGDVIDFVVRQKNLSFREAVEHLAETWRIELPLAQGGDGEALALRREAQGEAFRVLELAADFYHKLLQSPAGLPARTYAKARGIPEHLIQSERLGYASKGWATLAGYLKGRGIDPELGIRCGLLARSPRGTVYDRFRHRLLFPITDEHGRVASFGGRSLDGTEPKYLNGPESAVYQKGKMLYHGPGAREAAKTTRQVLLVEGYMDCLTIRAAGVGHVAATCGTALTSEQVTLLGRMADEVVLGFDGDAAGFKAMERAWPLFLKAGVPASCVEFPDGQDPDDFVRAHGAEGFQALWAARVELGQAILARRLSACDGSVVATMRLLKGLRSVFAAIARPVLAESYLKLLAERLSLPVEAVRSEVSGHPPERPAAVPPAKPGARGGAAETILYMLANEPSAAERVETHLGALQGLPLFAAIERLTRAIRREGPAISREAIRDAMPDEASRALITGWLFSGRQVTSLELALAGIEEIVAGLEAKRSRAEILEAIREAAARKDREALKALTLALRDCGSDTPQP